MTCGLNDAKHAWAWHQVILVLTAKNDFHTAPSSAGSGHCATRRMVKVPKIFRDSTKRPAKRDARGRAPATASSSPPTRRARPGLRVFGTQIRGGTRTTRLAPGNARLFEHLCTLPTPVRVADFPDCVRTLGIESAIPSMRDEHSGQRALRAPDLKSNGRRKLPRELFLDDQSNGCYVRTG